MGFGWALPEAAGLRWQHRPASAVSGSHRPCYRSACTRTSNRSLSEAMFGLWHVLSSTQAPRELNTLLQSPTLAVYTWVGVSRCTMRVVPPVVSRPWLCRANTQSSSWRMVACCRREGPGGSSGGRGRQGSQQSAHAYSGTPPRCPPMLHPVPAEKPVRSRCASRPGMRSPEHAPSSRAAPPPRSGLPPARHTPAPTRGAGGAHRPPVGWIAGDRQSRGVGSSGRAAAAAAVARRVGAGSEARQQRHWRAGLEAPSKRDSTT